jgi:dipeptidyl aminopeptidase/acylaminoacyl peptidase
LRYLIRTEGIRLKIRVQPTSFLSEEEQIHGHFVLPHGSGPFPGICKFHGLPGSSDQVSGVASELAKAGFAMLTFNFRGFRTSEGRFSLAGEVKDGQMAVTHLLESDVVTKNWVGIYGPSYGGAIAVLTTVRDPRISVVCLRAPVFDTLEFAQSHIFELGVEELLRTAPHEIHGLSDPQEQKRMFNQMIQESRRLNPMNEIAKVAPRPLFIVTGDADRGIPIEGVRRLFSKAREPKELTIIKGANHNLSDPQAYEQTMNAIITWFKRQSPI